MMDKEKLFAQIKKGGLIVSCQALETEPCTPRRAV